MIRQETYQNPWLIYKVDKCWITINGFRRVSLLFAIEVGSLMDNAVHP